MASSSELPEYSSKVKRRKIESEVYGVSVHFNIDFPEIKVNCDTQNIDIEEPLGGDSGFTDMSDGTKSMSNTPDSTHLSSTPSRTDSTSDDTGCPLDTADEKDEISSTVSNLSDLSGLSELSEETGQVWRSASAWVQKQMQTGTDPRDLLQQLLMDPTQIPEQVDDITLWKLVLNIMSDPPRRQKLSYVNTLNDVVRLIKDSKKIIVLTGAGVSVSCGIPDFRSRDGIYSRLAQDFPNLPDPQAMFDINFFAQDPRPFFKFAREIYPGLFKPSPCHRFIKMLEKHTKLLRNYSQNIDTLEQVAGIENVIECHGSFATASCTKCKFQVTAEDIRTDIFTQRIPLCPKCSTNALPSLATTNASQNYTDLVSQGIMKPDIVFFGEGLPDAFHDSIAKDKDECDLLIVIGSSLKVRPVALIPSSIPSQVPQILINRESLPHLKFDVELLGDGDIIINQLCHLMGEEFNQLCWSENILEETPHLLPPRFIDDPWDRSGETLSQNITDFVLKPPPPPPPLCSSSSPSSSSSSSSSPSYFSSSSSQHNISIESQDSLSINSNTTPKHLTSNNDICISPFHAGHMESTEEEGNFSLLGESPKRPLDDSSVESSPKRLHLHSHTSSGSTLRSIDDGEEERYSRFTRVISVESTAENNGQIFNLEECHVLPRIIDSHESVDQLLHIGQGFEEDEVEEEEEEEEEEGSKGASRRNNERVEVDKYGKSRHASIDSAIDSGIGDSCNSVDSSEAKGIEERRWQGDIKESLASRLPDNSYYQVSSSKYIFPGAEVYLEGIDDEEEGEEYGCSPSSRSPTISTITYAEDERRAT